MPGTEYPNRISFTLADSSDVDALAGDDTIVLAGELRFGRVVNIDGGADRDLLDLSALALGLSQGDGPPILRIADVFNLPGIAEVSGAGGGQYLRFANVETIRINAADYGAFDLRALSNAVTLIGGDVGNSFTGGAAFADRFIGGAGRDIFNMGVGDTAIGAGGDDVFAVRAGDAFTIDAGAGRDRIDITGATQLDLARATMINGGVTNQVAGIEDVTIRVEAGYRAHIFGSNGDNVIAQDVALGFTGLISAWGRGGSDTLSGNGYLNGGAGDDVLTGRGTLIGGDGADAMTGRGTLNGGAGDDVIRLTGVSRVTAGDGDDTIYQSFDRGDVILGGAGNDDIILNYATFDTIRTGPGADVIRFGTDPLSNVYARQRGGDIYMGGDDVLDLSNIVASVYSPDPGRSFRLEVYDEVLAPDRLARSEASSLIIISRDADGGWLVSGFYDPDAPGPEFFFTVHAPEGWWVDGIVL